MVALLKELGVPERPMATRAVCDGIDNVRRLAVTLCSLHNSIHKKEKELTTARLAAANRPSISPVPPPTPVAFTSNNNNSSSNESVVKSTEISLPLQEPRAPAANIKRESVPETEYHVTTATSDVGDGGMKRNAEAAFIEGISGDDLASNKRVKRGLK